MSLRNYMDLVHVSVEVDTSELQDRLREIEGGLDEDRVNELIRDYVDNEALVTSSDMTDAVQEALNDTDFESRISSLERLNTCGVDVNDLPTQIEGIADRIDALERGENAAYMVGETPLDQAFNSLVERVDTLTGNAQNVDTTLAQRIDLLNQRVAELETTLASRPAVQGLSLFELLTQAARILGIAR